MSCNDIQEPIAQALAELELVKAHLLKVYAWAGIPHIYGEGELSNQAMELSLGRASLPIARNYIDKALRIITAGIPNE